LYNDSDSLDYKGIHFIFQTEINGYAGVLQVTITIRYTEFDPVTGIDQIFQSIIEYSCMKSLVPVTTRYARFETDISGV